MKSVKHLLILISILFCVTISSDVHSEPSCEGPPELCQQILDLKSKLKAQKELDDNKKTEEVLLKEKEVEEKNSQRTAELIAAAASMAVTLKILISLLGSWKVYFTTDIGKAWVKVITLVAGLLAFFFTNVGLGLGWWQSFIVALGGPGSIAVHELMKLSLVLNGKKKFDEIES